MHTMDPLPSLAALRTQANALRKELSEPLNMDLYPATLNALARCGIHSANGPYLQDDGSRLLHIANKRFGANGWSSVIMNLSTDFLDYDEDTKLTNVGVAAVVRVTLAQNGTSHDDVGYGIVENSKSKGSAMGQARKDAVDDALQRCLRVFLIEEIPSVFQDGNTKLDVADSTNQTKMSPEPTSPTELAPVEKVSLPPSPPGPPTATAIAVAPGVSTTPAIVEERILSDSFVSDIRASVAKFHEALGKRPFSPVGTCDKHRGLKDAQKQPRSASESITTASFASTQAKASTITSSASSSVEGASHPGEASKVTIASSIERNLPLTSFPLSNLPEPESQIPVKQVLVAQLSAPASADVEMGKTKQENFFVETSTPSKKVSFSPFTTIRVIPHEDATREEPEATLPESKAPAPLPRRPRAPLVDRKPARPRPVSMSAVSMQTLLNGPTAEAIASYRYQVHPSAPASISPADPILGAQVNAYMETLKVKDPNLHAVITGAHRDTLAPPSVPGPDPYDPFFPSFHPAHAVEHERFAPVPPCISEANSGLAEYSSRAEWSWPAAPDQQPAEASGSGTYYLNPASTSRYSYDNASGTLPTMPSAAFRSTGSWQPYQVGGMKPLRFAKGGGVQW